MTTKPKAKVSTALAANTSATIGVFATWWEEDEVSTALADNTSATKIIAERNQNPFVFQQP